MESKKVDIEYHKKCLEKATRSGNHPEIADSTCILGDSFLHLGEYKKAIEHFEIGIQSCAELDNYSGLAAIQYKNMGKAYIELKEYQKAIDCLKNSLSLSDDQIAVARSNEDLGRVYFELGQYDEAINCHKLALDACTATGDQRGISDNYMNLGTCYGNMGEMRKAIECVKSGLEANIALDDRRAIATSHRILGVLYLHLGEHENAIYHFEQYLEITSSECGQPEITVINCLGEAYLNSRKYEKAIEFCKKGLEMSIATNDCSEMAKANQQLGKAYWNLGEHEKAIEHFKSALNVCIETKNQLGIASICTILGLWYGSMGENEKGIEFFNRGLEAYTALGDNKNIAVNSRKLGESYSKVGEHEKAICHHKKNLEVIISIGTQSEIAQSNSVLGDVYLSSYKYKEAIDSYKICLEIYTAIHHRKGMANANCQLGNAYNLFGEYERAIESYQKMLALNTAIGDQKEISKSYGNLGMVYVNLGENKKAMDYFKKVSTDPFDPNAEATEMEINGFNLATAYFHLSEYKIAIECSEKSLEKATHKGNRLAIAEINGLLGLIYKRMGEYGKSMKYLQESLKISTELNNRLSMISGNRHLGQAYLYLDEYETALDFSKKSLKIAMAVGIQQQIAMSNCILGELYSTMGKYELAIFYLKRGLEIITASGNRSLMASINLGLCGVYRSLQIYPKAFEHGKTSLKISTATGNPDLIAISNKSLGNVSYCSGQYEVASTYLIKAINDFDEQFLNTVPDQNKLSFTGTYFNAHEVLMSCFVSLRRIEAGLLVIDMGRAKELHLSIEKKQNSLDTNLFAYVRSIWDKIKNKEEHEEIARIQNILQVRNNEIKTSTVIFAFDLKNSLNFWILNDDIIFRVPQSDEKLETFARLISKLSQRFNVSMNRDPSFFKLHPCGNLFSQIDSRFKISSKMFELKTSPEKTPGKDIDNDTILKELYRLLIEPVKDVFKGNKLIVVPDKQLFFVPFSSLIDENDCYLSQSYSIQITPSLHTLKLSIQRPSDLPAPGFALFVGNPTVGKVSLNGSEFEPAILPKAAEEVACLSKLFAARPLVKGEAKKHVVLGLLRGASIIHIAAHGEPDRGEIMLAPDVFTNEPSSSFPNQDSYLLTQNDITSISLRARLVVLCCCHTGQGKISSEGVIGIARSFLAAGTRSVLATLWPIHDVATKEFMEALYDELLQETSVCEALRRVKNLFQQHEREEYRSFSVWAPFTLYGEDVMFTKHDIEKIREKSNEKLPECGFALFVGNPTSNLPKATEEVISLSNLFESRAFVEGEARKQVLLGLLRGASIIHISAHIEPKQCEIMLSPCVSSTQGISTLPKQDELLTKRDVQGISLKARLVVLCLCHAGQDELSPEGVESLAQAFLASGARSVLSTLLSIDDDATTEFMEAFYNQLLHESSVREALENAKELFHKYNKEAYQSFEVQTPFTIYGEDVMFQKHDVVTIREKSRKMFSGFVILP